MDYIAIIQRLAVKSTYQLMENGKLLHVGYTCRLCDSDWGVDDAPKHRFTCPIVSPPTITDYQVDAFQRAYREAPIHLGESLKIRHALAAIFSPDFVPTHRHKKRGTYYRVIKFEDAMLEKGWEPAVIYQATDGKWIARAKEEFEDGRFEEVIDPPNLNKETY